MSPGILRYLMPPLGLDLFCSPLGYQFPTERAPISELTRSERHFQLMRALTLAYADDLKSPGIERNTSVTPRLLDGDDRLAAELDRIPGVTDFEREACVSALARIRHALDWQVAEFEATPEVLEGRPVEFPFHSRRLLGFMHAIVRTTDGSRYGLYLDSDFLLQNRLVLKQEAVGALKAAQGINSELDTILLNVCNGQRLPALSVVDNSAFCLEYSMRTAECS